MTLPCAEVIESRDVRNAEMTILVDYRPPLVWWHKREPFKISAQKTEEGTWVWRNIPR